MSKKHDLDNHSNQMNPNNDAYWQSRGHEERPSEREDYQEEDEDDVIEELWDEYPFNEDN